MVSDFTPKLADRFMEKFFRQKKTLTVRTWINAGGIETVIDEGKVKLGSQDVSLPKAGQKSKYNIDYSRVQNIKGKLFYNTAHGVANGGLSFHSSAKHEVDAKIRKKMAVRDNLHAIWSKWSLPFIFAIVAIIVAIIAISLLAVFIGQAQTAKECLANEDCMVQTIGKLRAQAEANAKQSGSK